MHSFKTMWYYTEASPTICPIFRKLMLVIVNMFMSKVSFNLISLGYLRRIKSSWCNHELYQASEERWRKHKLTNIDFFQSRLWFSYKTLCMNQTLISFNPDASIANKFMKLICGGIIVIKPWFSYKTLFRFKSADFSIAFKA